MPLINHFNGGKKRKKPPKNADLIQAASMLPSVRKEFKANWMPEDPEEMWLLGNSLIDWSQQEEATSIDQFFLKRRMSPSRFMKACQTNEILSSCLDIALANIGVRLEEQVKNNQLYIINKLKQYTALSREEARLKREAEKDTQVTKIFEIENVQIPVFTKKGKE